LLFYDPGIAERDAAWIASTIGLSSISGRIVLGYLADKASIKRYIVRLNHLPFGPPLYTLTCRVNAPYIGIEQGQTTLYGILLHYVYIVYQVLN